MKKHLLLLWAILSINLSAQALNPYDFQSGELFYDITSDSTVEVTYQYYFGSIRYDGLTTVSIPEIVTYEDRTYSVTSIRAFTFQNCTTLVSIVIPNSVTSIGNGAFAGCSALTSVSLPKGITKINQFLFSECTNLSEIIIPEGVVNIEKNAFFNCSSLTHVTIPNSVKSIGESAFWCCSKVMPFLIIPQMVSNIGEKAFYKIPIIVYNGSATGSAWGAIRQFNGYADADSWLVYDCETKQKVLYCSPLASGEISLPTSVTSIEEKAFERCKSITNVNIPDSVTSIGDYAFSNCLSLTSIAIPHNITHIGNYVFDNCINLTSVIVGNSVSSIGNNAFKSCSSLTSINLPNLVTSIGNHAFSYCSSLTSINLPNSINSIGNYAFYCCASLDSIIIPENITNIGDGTFGYCSSLTSIRIPQNVTRVGNRVFEGCDNLTSVTWEAIKCEQNVYKPLYEHTYYYGPFADVSSQLTSFTFGENVDSIPAYLCYDMSNLSSVDIPNNIIGIGKEAFYGCSNLTSVVIPKNVTIMGDYAFQACTNLTSVTINTPTIISNKTLSNIFGKQVQFYILGDSINSIGKCAFKDCRDMVSITIPENVTFIGEGAFQNCSSLTAITIPENIAMMEGFVFDGCSNITSVVWNARSCHHNWTSNKETPFYGISSHITSFIFGDKVDSIPLGLCNNMSNLSTLIIGDSITNIGYTAFLGCSGLKTITIGSGIKSITGLVFMNCSHIDTIFCRALVPPTDSANNAFYGVPTSATLIVPCESYDAYLVTNPWYRFQTIRGTFPPSARVSSVDEIMGYVSIDKQMTCGDSTIIFSAISNVGFRFKQWSDSCIDNPRTVFVTQDTSFVAEFDIQTYKIDLFCDSTQGFVNGSGIYQEGKEITIQAIANKPYRFKYWSDGNTENPRSITLLQDTSIMALFDDHYYIKTIFDEQKGVVIGGGEYPYGTLVEITAIANDQYDFCCWNNNSNENPYTIVLTEDTIIEAYFNKKTEEDIKNNSARNDKTQVNKIMKNGQVLILRNGVAYDMLGNIIDIRE